MTHTLLPLAYAGPIAHWIPICKQQPILWEAEDFYQKQTYRNRMEIHAANGKLMLSIPIQHLGYDGHQNYKDVYIDKTKRTYYDIPNCFNYKDESQTKDFLYLINQEYKSMMKYSYGNEKKNLENIVKRDILYDEILFNYYSNSLSKYGEMYGKIMTPDMRTKNDFKTLKNSRHFKRTNDI